MLALTNFRNGVICSERRGIMSAGDNCPFSVITIPFLAAAAAAAADKVR